MRKHLNQRVSHINCNIFHLMQAIAEKLIKEALEKGIEGGNDLQKLKNQYSARYNLSSFTNQELIQAYRNLLQTKKIQKKENLEKILKKRAIRSLSGVAVVTVLTKPYPCPGRCVFCPTEKQMPKSYLSNEPGAMRALLNDFEPFKQVKNRLRALEASGHPTDKIELIVLGGTFSSYKKVYQKYFICQCINALNGGKKERSLAKALKKNEKVRHRLVGLSLETRPDHVTEKEIIHFRNLGCTKIQLGVQHLDDEILDYVKRGHHKKEAIESIRICKDAGLKVSIHMMPNLPGSTPEKDLKMFQEIFANPDFRPDYLKVYPCVVTPFSELEHWYRRGEYSSYSDEVLEKLLVEIKKTFPRYVRVDRLIRDIPGESIIEGSKITNLRQEIKRKYPKLKCQCIRCREIRDEPIDPKKIKYEEICYEASEGTEYFLSFTQHDKICALLRLRFVEKSSPDSKPRLSRKQHFIKEISGASIVRELHTYGIHVALGKREKKAHQHLGLGKKLMQKAEKISKKNGFKRIAVISSIGTRQYYRKLDYRLKGTYMMKKLTKK
ncbi:tRNA uridine(34) 5-carboxymethylaminomethyl modification radical SAM/GNAT enzyme Elp3 [Candidatus Peregrinibacteria bacterium]|nr:tRNA uridine(34) 5-carboxymethylaminomethyl modification radical SAM/GNAT enzyme Elp3 [Candidatus Peregrinibacteria bacterium]